MVDRVSIHIRGLEVFGYHGVHEEERRLGQRFVVDVDLDLLACPGVASDALDGTVDYAALTAAVADIVAGPPSRLIEHLAGRIADLALDHPLADRVTVGIDKPQVALPHQVRATGVRLQRRRLHTYWIGLGGNLGDRLAALQAMLDATAARGVLVDAVSPVYETAPQLVTEQPDFLNAAVRVRSTLAPWRMLALLKRLERRLGRTTGGPRFGPRPIDADILLWDGGAWVDDRLSIPHPRLAVRRFALVPLLAIHPDAALPDGTRIDALERDLPAGEDRVARFAGELRVPDAGAPGAPSGSVTEPA